MSVLTINNYAVEILDANVSWEPVGAQIRTQSGKVARSIVRNMWQCDITFLFDDFTTTKALATLLRGDGETWNFDDATYYQYGSKGSGLVVGSTSARGTTTPDPVLGSAYLMVNSGAYSEFDIALDSNVGWTVMFWHNPTQTAAGTWTHYAVTSAGNHYVNGSFSALAAQYLLTTANSRPRLNGKNTSNTNTASSYDHLVVIPAVLPAAMISAFSSNSVAFSLLPNLTLTGDLISDTYGSSITAQVDITSISSEALNVNGDVEYTLRAKFSSES